MFADVGGVADGADGAVGEVGGDELGHLASWAIFPVRRGRHSPAGTGGHTGRAEERDCDHEAGHDPAVPEPEIDRSFVKSQVKRQACPA